MFWGVQYDDVYPPSRQFNNAANCQEHIDFINHEITSRLQSGAVTLLGKVGEVQPPHIVSPITIEPTKPRLCINLMYLNSFMKDTPFNIDTLVNVPKTVQNGSFLTKLDDKSGYDNVFGTESSRHLLGNTMIDKDGKSLPHFTPFPTPVSLSSRVDAFAQTYNDGERYYAFPPFCLIPTVKNFILQERLSCTLVFPDFKPVQPWFPVVLAHASQVVPIGFRGDTGVLLYPSKKGFLSDKKGLQWNMLAASFCFDRVHEKIENKLLPQKNFVPFLIIGDSIIKCLSNTNKNVNVISISGGKLLDGYFSLVEFLKHSTSFVVMFHCGTNNINKSAKPETAQLENAVRDLNIFFLLISELQKVKKFAFIFSGCVYTKNEVINLRINKLNTILEELCKKGKHLYIDQSNISSSDLRDVVHFNESGLLLFVRNLSGFL
ncbi:unnamed protein product [Mytilus coruscus]|uniref:Uncharacterized protein n=1 Tax=Mytilus coruscus TaxID=42192 RepID=A0A6J8BA15_MYTCO|nr:unnamed protein product [Mytilus coruscus]